MSLLRHAQTEKELQGQVVEFAKFSGWQVFHPYDSRRSEPGYPDLTLARENMLFVELKTATGELRPEQKIWRDALLDAGADWRLWRPDSWPEIEETLRRKR